MPRSPSSLRACRACSEPGETKDWTLYRLTYPTPLASGGRVTDLEAAGVTIDVPRAGAILLRIRWTPALVVESGDSDTATLICPVATADGMTTVALPAGRRRIAPDLLHDATQRLDHRCDANLRK
jgi:hypothetical protein